MQVGGFSSAGAIWLNSLGKTGAPGGSELFQADSAGQKEPAKPAGANTSFPTAPPVSLGAEGLLALQQVDAKETGDAIADAGSSAADEFLDYMKKTPEERLRDRILKALGVTEEELEAMPVEERLAVEEKIREIVKETIVPEELTRGATDTAKPATFADLLRAGAPG